ncbi:hypothetical protein B0T22DRAFT_463142 [Podospora appendiculata]|uniref:ABM domain-containing protein n=1 Tax=Podospora appendiculata TaxID=314037 RepID=A0AAE0XCN6_9PEZI|nr:hypothetical protein B0T22DRAFT_463142 [Podospora appendiculata]
MAAFVQLLQIPLSGGIQANEPAWTSLIEKLRGANGLVKVLWATQHENSQVAGIAAIWKSLDAHKEWTASSDGIAFQNDLVSIASAPIHADFVVFTGSVDVTLAAHAVELVSWIHPAANLTEAKEKAVEEGFAHFQTAISAEAPQSDGGLVAGWGQVEFEHKGVPSRRFTCLIGWKSVEAHYECKTTPVFTDNIHHLRDPQAIGVEMVHYAFSESAQAGYRT